MIEENVVDESKEIQDLKEAVNLIKINLKSNINKNNLNVEEFEKDNDSNFHIDFIYSMANIRASNY